MEAWEGEKAFNDCSQSVAALKVTYPRKLGIEGKNVVAYATAFVVSFNPLVFLTNKHVLTCAGLAHIEANFPKRPLKDKVSLRQIYIDPIHDFALCSCDSKPTDHSLFDPVYKVKPLKLSSNIPEKGKAILAIGGIKGKAIDRVPGKIVDTEVNPPNGMDYNLSYIEASDESPPGFSGGPVVNRHGEVVALVSSNFEGRSFHIPAKHIKKILKAHLNGHPISRGTLNFALEADLSKYDKDGDELDRSRRVFKVAKELIHDGKILVDDEIYKVRGRELQSLSHFEELINLSVGKDVSLEILRPVKGTKKLKKIKVKRKVDDLRESNITTILEFSNAIMHEPEYNVLTFYNIEPHYSNALFVSQQGYLFKHFHIPEHALVTEIGNVNLLDTESSTEKNSCIRFVHALKDSLANGHKLITICFELLAKRKKFRRNVILQPRWFPTVVYKLNDRGRWGRDVIDLMRNEQGEIRRHTSFNGSIANVEPSEAGVTPAQEEVSDGPARLMKLLVHIRFIQPFDLDGNEGTDNFVKQCAGVIVDSKRGLIICERYLVSSALGDCIVTFDGRKSVVGRVVLVHPTHLFSIIKVSSSELAANHILLPFARLSDVLSTSRVQIGEKLAYYGLTLKQSKIRCGNLSVTTKEPMHRHNHVKYTPKNASYFTTSLNPGSQGIGGFFYSERKKQIVGFNVHLASLKAFCGIQTFMVLKSASQLLSSKFQTVDILPVALYFPILVDAVVSHCLDEATELEFVERMGSHHRTLLGVETFFPRPLEKVAQKPVTDLEEGDIIRTVNDHVVTNLRSLALSLTKDNTHNTLEVITQNGEVTKRDLKFLTVPAVEVDEVIIISGAVFHKPSLHLLSCVYPGSSGKQAAAVLSQIMPGSPASKVMTLQPGEVKFISMVNDEALLNFDHFVIAVKEVFKNVRSSEALEHLKLEVSGPELEESEEVLLDIRKLTLMFWAPRQIRRNMQSLNWTGKELYTIKRRASRANLRNSTTAKSSVSGGALKVLKMTSGLGAKFKKKLGKSKDVSSV